MITMLGRKIFLVFKFIFSSTFRFSYLLNKGMYFNKSDEYVIKRKYKAAFDRVLDLNNPIRYTEKLQWLKLYDRREIYSTMVDKYKVKKYVAEGYIPEKDRIVRHIDIEDCRVKIERFLLSKEDLDNPQLLVLTDEERKEIEELWEELAI